MKAAEDPSKFKEAILNVHNRYRAIHGSPPLRMDEKLNERAQSLAKSLSEKGVEVQIETVPYGENVYIAFDRDLNWRLQPDEPVQYWYEESKYYQYDTPRPRNLKNVRNFTQLIWKETSSMGIGMIVGPDGKVYLVCSYAPMGNVEGEYQLNVVPPEEEDVESLSLEDLGLSFVEPSADVVRSIERLYAVPSEKLRVWTVWLSSIGEMAEEWQKWLRAHIDLIIRLTESLQMAANDVPEEKKIDSVVNAKPVETLYNATPAEEEKEDIVGTGTREAAVASEKAVVTAATWPIGTRWQPLTRPIEREADQMETIRDIRMPRDKAEMLELLKDFTHQATIYRSYYAHWKETADQAIKEIAGRTVMATAKIRGTGKVESADVADAESAQYSMKQAESAVAHTIEGSVQLPAPATAPAPAVTPMSSAIDPSTDAPGRDTEEPIALSDDQSKVAVLSTETIETEVESPATAELTAADATAYEMQSETTDETSAMESTISIAPTEIVTTLPAALLHHETPAIRDMARADESIPYFFYVRAEPNIDIAIQHDDERVIAPDFDRENISANRTYLYFNLADKPGKS